ncbi:hypothetical protein [Kribbella jiaozuonensis]|uniref:Uncharacterized protein n=1 Tax=Kribbella jiaozuonensis TaxID=2575441 RepID=A0A4V5UW44_9ACTN|nr:hypothetical protein [Kribbella jiaozuonensis]TKK75543.1 hypothetical protein FDA38_34700 [Kribbella jiaozuonensis]
MRDVGDVSAEVWDEELRRTGRVVFPLRRRSALQALLPLLAVAVLVVLGPLLAGAPPPDVDVLFVVAAYAVLIGPPVYQLVTQRPAVVDLDGILRLSQRNVRDLPEFRGWLGTVLADQRRTPTSHSS